MTMWKPVALIVVFRAGGVGTGASGGASPPDLP